jgi:hypothetical protein
LTIGTAQYTHTYIGTYIYPPTHLLLDWVHYAACPPWTCNTSLAPPIRSNKATAGPSQISTRLFVASNSTSISLLSRFTSHTAQLRRFTGVILVYTCRAIPPGILLFRSSTLYIAPTHLTMRYSTLALAAQVVVTSTSVAAWELVQREVSAPLASRGASPRFSLFSYLSYPACLSAMRLASQAQPSPTQPNDIISYRFVYCLPVPELTRTSSSNPRSWPSTSSAAMSPTPSSTIACAGGSPNPSSRRSTTSKPSTSPTRA